MNKLTFFNVSVCYDVPVGCPCQRQLRAQGVTCRETHVGKQRGIQRANKWSESKTAPSPDKGNGGPDCRRGNHGVNR